MGIVKAEITDLEQCIDLLFIPEVGQLYFPRRELLRVELEENLNKDEIYVEKTKEEQIIRGVIWYQQSGLFHSFPYLHMIAVRDTCRQQGIGNKLLEFFEQNSLHNSKNQIRTRTFLLVSDFNKSAQDFYRKHGYEEIGKIKNLFRKDVTENLFMKKVKALGRK